MHLHQRGSLDRRPKRRALIEHKPASTSNERAANVQYRKEVARGPGEKRKACFLEGEALTCYWSNFEFKGEKADKCARVGREEEGSSSNRPELGGVVLALQSAVGQGGKATLATAPDADILQEIVCLLTQRANTARASRESYFLIKVKSHRGEPINERADTLAEEGREISDDNKRCGTSERIAWRLRCRKGTRRCDQCGRIAYATPFESKQGDRRKEQRHQGVGVSERAGMGQEML